MNNQPSNHESEQSDQTPDRDVPNPWIMKSNRNPYLHNIFTLLGIDPDGTQKSYDRASQRWSQKVSATKEIRFGREISDLDVARAAHLARQEYEYVVERLLAHTVHELDISDLKHHMDGVHQLELPLRNDVLPLRIRNLNFLASRLPPPQSPTVSEETAFPIELLPNLFSPSAGDEDIAQY